MSPVGWKLRARQLFSADKTRICSSRTVSIGRATLCSSRTVAGQCQIRSGMHPFRLEVATTESREVRVSDTLYLTRPTDIQNSLALAKPAADRAVPCRESEISQQQNGGGVVPTQNRARTRSVGSPGPDSSSVQTTRDFAAAKER